MGRTTGLSAVTDPARSPPGCYNDAMDNGSNDTDRDVRARRDGLLALAVLGALGAAFVIAADPWSLPDSLTRDVSVGIVAGSFILLGAAFGVSLWAMIAGRRWLRLTVVLSMLAVVGLVVAVSAVSVAVVRLPAADSVAAALDQPADAPPTTVVAGPLPFEKATAVFLDLTTDGRTRLAQAMGCTRADLVPGPVAAVAVGGTHASPIVNVRIVNDFGEFSAACDGVRMRIPADEVVVVPAALD